MSPKLPPHLFALYVHWPYCLSKCPYCDFASCVNKNIDEDTLFQGYLRDLKQFQTTTPVTSIFFGGGTPSLMSLHLIDKLMNSIQKYYTLTPDCEISMEVNPDAITKEKMVAFHKGGINRLSIGIQSLNKGALQFLGRKHSVQTAIKTIQSAQEIFQNINIDLIYARPHQKLKDWETELQKALSFQLSHYSLYQLTIEPNTVFAHRHISLPSETQMRKMYLLTDEIMSQAKCPAYEVSNYARKSFECRHNMTYWLGCDYIGVGPAAHGRIGLIATQNPASVPLWIKNGVQTEKLTTAQRELEKLLMGIRLRKHPYPTKNLDAAGVQQALQKNWIYLTKEGLIPTLEGILMLNKLTLILAP